MRKTKRLNIALSDKEYTRLQELCEAVNFTYITEAIVDAIALYHRMVERKQQGWSLLLGKDNELMEVDFKWK